MIARNEAGSEQLEHLERLVVAELRSLWEALGVAESGEAAEGLVLAWGRRVQRAALEAGLQARVEGVQAQAARTCACGGRQQVHSYRPRVVLTLLGSARVVRQYLLCAGCGARRFPADRWLGWKAGFSRRLQEAVAWGAAGLPYRQALAGIRRLCGVELSLSAAQAIVGRWGAQALELAPYEERVKGRMVVGIDGTKAHLGEGWREVKLASFGGWRGGKAQAVSYVADWLAAQEFAQPLWQEALVRGAPRAKAVAVLADGAPWIWETAHTLFPRGMEILDWYHACEHLWAAGKVVHGDGTAQTAELVERWKEALREGRSQALEEQLRELAPTVADPEQTLRKTADYLATHQARLRYSLFRQAGWPIGSGVVEGGCKHVIDLRFKRKSTRWKEPGARAVLHLRLDLLSERWEKRCDHLRQAA